jgi:hypothetical protein
MDKEGTNLANTLWWRMGVVCFNVTERVSNNNGTLQRLD